MNEQASKLVLALDIGTTSVKALLIDRLGQMKGRVSIGYPLNIPRPDMAEQDPDTIYEAVATAVHRLLQETGTPATDLLCVSLSSAMHSLIVVDAEHRPLTGSIIWADQRAVEQADRLNADGTGLAIYRRTGVPIHPMTPLTKLLWLREHRPDLMLPGYSYVDIKAYVLQRLFGRSVMDYSIAGSTGLFNLHELDWDGGVLELLGLSAAQLPELVPTDHVMVGLQPGEATKLGLLPDTPFVVGASDGVLANLGAGVMNTDRVAVSIGTSSAVRTVVPEPLLDEQGKLFCYALTKGNWVVGAPSNNGGIVLRWLVEQLFADELGSGEGDPYERLLELAQQAPAGANGLIFLPMLTGERAPYWKADTRAMYFGLSLSHGKAHMVRAALEGVMAQIASIVQLLEGLHVQPREVWASGGFTQSVFGCQLMADMLGLPVCVPQLIESSGLGAAMLGYAAMGKPMQAPSAEAAASQTRYLPDPARHAHYRKLLELHARVYEGIKDSFHDVIALQAEDTANLMGVLK
ncbi:gluconokinase [Paenibacillus sp. IB182496]|uniref:Gluconokinase n=1 Tax=Paenibacillus sabuli TaxID=2772509 RepID=A0A927GR27_9BACL|nr:gluconokinase [Paenibacillus sabuli]MBD2844998.1 gluconokinase [Paenibacillus sabuli]